MNGLPLCSLTIESFKANNFLKRSVPQSQKTKEWFSKHIDMIHGTHTHVHTDRKSIVGETTDENEKFAQNFKCV